MKENNYPKIAVIISLYNYEKYILECIDSIKNQHYPNLRIIVVNDGSSDNSLQCIEGISDIEVVNKPNGGQLSAFNAGYENLNDEEIIFFFDADDVMNEGYINEVLLVYEENPQVDYVFCRSERFCIDGKIEQNKALFEGGILGFGLYRTYYLKDYLGASTSTLSIRKALLDKILPLSLEEDWRIRADDCIIWGASLVGGNIYHLQFIGVKYRIHTDNNHFGKAFGNEYLFKRELCIERMFEIIMRKNLIRFSASSLYMEFLSNFLALKYIKITLLSKLSIYQKILLILRILKCKILNKGIK